MMSGLMMVFLFIAISFMIEINEDKEKILVEKETADKIAKKSERMANKLKRSQESIKKIVITYRKAQLTLNNDLNKEFKKDLDKWDAEITKDNIFRFNSPEVLFKAGSSKISNQFKKILDDFFPRYIKLLTSKKYINEIDEIRIEGHTSNEWGRETSEKIIYLNNMNLSQSRANHVLVYCYNNKNQIIKTNRKWLEKQFRANGMAFAKLIYKKDGTQNFIKSRRVEFKVLTKAQDKIYKIIEQLGF